MSPRIPNPGSRWWWVVSFTSRPPYPSPGWRTSDTHWIGRWMGPTASMSAAAKTEINPCPLGPPCGPVLYRLSHPGSYVIQVKWCKEVRSKWLLFTHAHTHTHTHKLTIPDLVCGETALYLCVAMCKSLRNTTLIRLNAVGASVIFIKANNEPSHEMGWCLSLDY
jgi:hypothetical protein